MLSGLFSTLKLFLLEFSYPALFQGGLIYEAKVQALQKEEGVTLYRIHYKVTFLLDTSFVRYNRFSHK